MGAADSTLTQTLTSGQVSVIETRWAVPCAEVMVGSTNGRETNLDNVLLDSAPVP